MMFAMGNKDKGGREAKKPKKKKSPKSEGFSQAPVRIVREAPKD
jgi:hypothetical protein